MYRKSLIWGRSHERRASVSDMNSLDVGVAVSQSIERCDNQNDNEIRQKQEVHSLGQRIFTQLSPNTGLLESSEGNTRMDVIGRVNLPSIFQFPFGRAGGKKKDVPRQYQPSTCEQSASPC